MRIGAAELASSDIALHLNNETETAQSSNQEMTVQYIDGEILPTKVLIKQERQRLCWDLLRRVATQKMPVFFPRPKMFPATSVFRMFFLAWHASGCVREWPTRCFGAV